IVWREEEWLLGEVYSVLGGWKGVEGFAEKSWVKGEEWAGLEGEEEGRESAGKEGKGFGVVGTVREVTEGMRAMGMGINEGKGGGNNDNKDNLGRKWERGRGIGSCSS
ncbi:hypothetical protein C0992_005463, partial [Termitomyces sp. T32_za158]